MFRAAITPIVRQRHRKLFVATCMTGTAGAACIATPSQHLHRSEAATCSPSVYNDGQVNTASQSLTAPFASLSLPNFFDDVEQCRSLILPTMEALLRAARLAKTAVIMATDYQVYFLQRKHPDSLVSEAYSWVFQCNNHSAGENSYTEEQGRKQKQLEDQIEQLERDLDRAQQNYVDPKTTSNDMQPKNESADADADAVYKSTSAVSEHTLAKRQQKEAMMETASQLGTVQEELASLVTESRDGSGNSLDGIHKRNAHRLLELCRKNGGVYIKVGQHLANLDLLVPEEYIQTLASLFDNAPVSSYEDVCHVVKQELGSLPEQLFSQFSENPLASASLAQVHTAICKETGKKLAIKVQHKGLRETSKGDLFAMTTVVSIAEKLFDDFNFGWICEELTPQLPKELDFSNEGKNAEAAAAHLSQTGLDCVVPHVYWNCTSERVLTMEFEEGFRATDVDSIEKAGICRREVAKLISSVFNAQIFGPGFVHCDPHEANVLLREHPSKKGKPQMVLVDHGLYKKLDDDFQEAYARLWTGIVMANVPEIKSACEQLGVNEMYPLLASMLTSRPFDEVVERSQTRSLDASPTGNGDGDKAVIRGYAQRYLKDIIAMLDVVPRQMLLIFKMNDCLRHVDTALGSPVNNLVVAGKYASKRVFESDKRKHKRSNGGVLGFLRSWLSYVHVLIRISSYELTTRLNITQ
mmetsp:Transcript_18111/g.39132  ORF Transcript_18111/g.39132 Transcript_18111/m.39132 type:complete len:696 (+) Transcript_18111:159-2246(+)